MKTIKILFWVLLTVVGFTACEDQRNPIINEAALDGSLTFKLNDSQYSNLTYVLEDANGTKEMDALTCVQPDYGFTAAVAYTVQVSFSQNMADSIELPTTVNGEKVGMITKEMNKVIIQLYGGKLPDPIVEKDVYVRLKALISGASDSPEIVPLYSNVIKLKVQPYVFPLLPYTEVTTKPYYIVGLGDGAWNNSSAGLGVSLIPLSVTSGKKYDLGGNGEFTYTGYFKASRGFKLIRDLGSWGEQWGMTGGAYVHNGGDNITVPADGYYTITLNSIDNVLTITPATVTPATYTKMGLIGAFNDWATDVDLTATESSDNHIWYTTYTFSAASECKFRANGNWDVNWGDATFPVGIGTAGGTNIPAKAGTYVVIFNDIDGCFNFIKK
jgi:hypothetical protein